MGHTLSHEDARMISRARYVLVGLPLALLVACNHSSDGSAESAVATAPNAAAPTVAMTAPAPAGTSSMMIAAPLPSRLAWNSLSSQVGKYQNQIDLFEHGPISAELKKLLGDHVSALQHNPEVAGPLQKDGNTYYMIGNAPHHGGQDQAYLLIAPVQRALEVGLWQAGELRTWKTPDTSITKPADVQRILTKAKDMPAGAVSTPPSP